MHAFPSVWAACLQLLRRSSDARPAELLPASMMVFSVCFVVAAYGVSDSRSVYAEGKGDAEIGCNYFAGIDCV